MKRIYMKINERMCSIRQSGMAENEGEKCEEEDDRITALPDCLIEHILSLLPSTKDAIRTGVLSKRWLHLWSHIPILIFKSEDGMPIENFSNFIDKALNLCNCSKVNKFVIDSNETFLNELGCKLDTFIRFATERDVKELILDCFEAAAKFPDDDDNDYKYELPQFIFNNAFLVKLKTLSCLYMPKIVWKVNWESLKALNISFSYVTTEAMHNVLSGSPVIEYLELCNCYGFRVQQNVEIYKIAIASKSLKKLRINKCHCSVIEISCPNLEKLELLGRMRIISLKFDLPPSVCATLDFKIGHYHFGAYGRSAANKLKLVEEFLLQVQHVEELKLGPKFLKILSYGAVGAKSSILLNCKCLTVLDPFSLARQPGLPISCLKFSLLEKLVIHQCPEDRFLIENSMKVKKDCWEIKCWRVDFKVFDNLLSHLKTVEIVGLTYRAHRESYNDVLKFVKFMLTNARMLEKMVLLEYPGSEMDFAHKVYKKLSCIRKYSPNAIVKVACLKWSNSNYDWDKIVY